MEFHATQAPLAKALTQVSRVVQPQNTLPILSGIELKAADGLLTLTATDLTVQIQVELPVDVATPGQVILPASTLTDLVNRLPTATVAFTLNPSTNQMTVRYGRNHTVINGFADSSLPMLPMLTAPHASITLSSAVLSAFSRQLLFATSKEETRPILKGIFLQLGSGRLVAAATDGSRLSQTWVPVPDYRGEDTPMVLPAKILLEAARLGGGAQPLTLSLGSEVAEFFAAGVRLTTRLLNGQYPDYQRVIPVDYVATIRVDLPAFRGALERVNLIASKDRAGSVRLSHTPGQIAIAATASEVGQAFESLDCDSSGPELQILFNPAYLLEAVKSLDCDEMILEFSGVHSAARIREPENNQYLHILLPLRQAV